MGMRSLLLILLFWSSANGQPVGKRFPSEPLTNSFCNTAAITSATQRSALYCMAIDIKRNNLLSLFNTLYPMVGGSLTSCSYNFINTSTFQITWTGSPTPNSSGVAFNGTSQYGNTNLTPSTSLSLNDVHLSYYSQTDGTTAYEIGSVTTGAGNTYLDINIKSGDNNTYTTIIGSELSMGAIVSNGKGYFIGSRTGSTGFTFYQNGSSIGTRTVTSTSLPTRTITINALNNNTGINNFSNRTCSFVSIGSSLTSGQATTFSTIVNNYQTALGRNTY